LIYFEIIVDAEINVNLTPSK